MTAKKTKKSAVKKPVAGPPPPAAPIAPIAPKNKWELSAVRGVQAGHLYYTVMVKLRDVPRLLAPVDMKARPEDRAQRVINKSRVPKIATYILRNEKSYILSALTGTIDGDPVFRHVDNGPRDIGTLEIDFRTPVSCLDGQHRRAAIAAALADPASKRTSLADESIPIVLFIDTGLARAQQAFVDLNRFGVRIPNALCAAYDQRDVHAVIARAVVRGVTVFAALTDTERAACAGKSDKLFSLGAINAATKDLLASISLSTKDAERVAVDFWNAVVEAMSPWREVAACKARSADLRKLYVHAHAVGLQAIGRAGNAIIRAKDWPALVAMLADIDWRRDSGAWEGRAMLGGQMSKSQANVILTANAIKKAIGIELSPEDLNLEMRLVGYSTDTADEEKANPPAEVVCTCKRKPRKNGRHENACEVSKADKGRHVKTVEEDEESPPTQQEHAPAPEEILAAEEHATHWLEDGPMTEDRLIDCFAFSDEREWSREVIRDMAVAGRLTCTVEGDVRTYMLPTHDPADQPEAGA